MTPTALPGLMADIGGTNARFALCDALGRERHAAVLHCADHAGPAAAAAAYLTELPFRARPRRGAFAVAAPVSGDRVTLTNHPWAFSIAAVKRRLGLSSLVVINDFAALALAVPRLKRGEVRAIGGGRAARNAPIALLGPGTGLGVSALVPSATGWVPLATEGGHVNMPACTAREEAVLAWLRRDFGHVSAERVLSGPGLANIYRALLALDGEEMETEPAPEEIAALALAGTSRHAAEALDMFCAMLGTVAGNLALGFGARGGVYIAGGIVPSLGTAFERSSFRRRFEDKGRMSPYVEAIPTFVVTRALPAFLGLGTLLAVNGKK
jgi:glucokinase